MSARTECDDCETALVPDANYCHQCGHRIAAAPTEIAVTAEDLVTVKLHGLYDEGRREELALALIPILADLSGRIDMGHVEHLDVGALTSLVPLLEARENESRPPIDVIGMNDDVFHSLTRADFAKFFNRLD